MPCKHCIGLGLGLGLGLTGKPCLACEGTGDLRAEIAGRITAYCTGSADAQETISDISDLIGYEPVSS